jgi:hypothetical protein
MFSYFSHHRVRWIRHAYAQLYYRFDVLQNNVLRPWYWLRAWWLTRHDD